MALRQEGNVYGRQTRTQSALRQEGRLVPLDLSINIALLAEGRLISQKSEALRQEGHVPIHQ